MPMPCRRSMLRCLPLYSLACLPQSLTHRLQNSHPIPTLCRVACISHVPRRSLISPLRACLRQYTRVCRPPSFQSNSPTLCHPILSSYSYSIDPTIILQLWPGTISYLTSTLATTPPTAYSLAPSPMTGRLLASMTPCRACYQLQPTLLLNRLLHWGR